jgi:small-conductance mechanosensitive channel
MNTSTRLFCLILSLFLVVWCLVLAIPLGAQENNSQNPETLLKVLTEGAASLERDIAKGKADADAVEQRVKQETVNLQNLRARIATFKASLAAGELQLKQAQGALESFPEREGQIAAQLNELQEQRQKLAKQLEARINAFNGLKQEVEHLKATKHPIWTSPEFRKAYERYQQLAKQYQTGATLILELWDKVISTLGQERQIFIETTKELKNYVEVGWKEELLKRERPVSLVESMNQTWQTLTDLPERFANYLTDPKLPKKVSASLRDKWAQLLGLLALFLILAWIAQRLRQQFLPRMHQWQTDVEELGLKVIFKGTEIIFSHFFGLGFIAWLALTIWIMEWWQREVARILLLGVSVWVGLIIGLQLIQALFAGKERGGILPLEETTAHFYRRHLKLLLLYVLILKFFGLNLLQFLGVEATIYGNLEALVQVGFMVWVLWLLRPRYLESLRTDLPEPTWNKARVFFLTVRALVLLVLGTIVLTSLLGFQNLSAYIAKGASLTGLAVVLFWMTWEGVRAVLDYALHPEKEEVPEKAWPEEAPLREYILAIVRVTVTILVAGAFLLILKLWEVDLGFLFWISKGLTWGIKLGPFSLNLLNLVLAVLTLYLGRWFSRLLQALLELRFYPQTDWDESIRYTISNTCHYTILAITILMALGFLGVSFADLAIVAAGLGVGIGFGLQNIVNNFISGLILLFERPIKVGDMLVIDGQWGAVKEIRMRSTIFQTYDRYVLIIPNSELISTKVLNWTYYGPGVNRITLKIGVSYGSDVHQVTKLLNEVCRANPRVLDDPPPLIYFEAYGDSSLNFNIWAYVNIPFDRIPATHELNSAIFEAFHEHGIEIPFPQRDLYIKSWPAPPSPRPLGSESEDESGTPPKPSP